MTYCYLIHVKIFPARQDGMWYDYPLCGPDKCYIASFTTEARVQYVLCVPCEGYGCRGGRPGGGRERERHPPELLSSALLSVPVYCTVQADTAGDGEEWGTVRPRPETSGCDTDPGLTRQYLLLSVPVPGPRCDSGCGHFSEKYWQNHQIAL